MCPHEKYVGSPGWRRKQQECRGGAVPTWSMGHVADRKHATRGDDRVADIEEFRARRARVVHKFVLVAGRGGELRAGLREDREWCWARSGPTGLLSAARTEQAEGERDPGPRLRFHAPSVAGMAVIDPA